MDENSSGINWNDLLGSAIERAPDVIRGFNPPNTNPPTATQIPDKPATAAGTWWDKPAVLIGAAVLLVVGLIFALRK